ncbi:MULTISPECIES: PRD domain-containing protein [Cedecea]|uniref:PRD domain-containing protein n=1 Tax=Cedecea TaxID=158483 RepID=UPI00143E295C|nr:MULTISPECIES: PRD domain-containing protein [Cedecea]QIX98403.1 PRD domain-containing protein [Cedecea sp. FDAARGOS_727]
MEDRLNLLCDAGVIDRDICDGMKQVVAQLETRWAIPLQNDQGTMAITHMANALMRSRRGEEVGPLDPELLAEIKADSVFGEVEQVHHALLVPFSVQLHPNEEGYLLANLFSLWLIHKS